MGGSPHYSSCGFKRVYYVLVFLEYNQRYSDIGMSSGGSQYCVSRAIPNDDDDICVYIEHDVRFGTFPVASKAQRVITAWTEHQIMNSV